MLKPLGDRVLLKAETEEEKKYLMGQMFAPMIVGGFVTVTITSVMIAGVFANML